MDRQFELTFSFVWVLGIGASLVFVLLCIFRRLLKHISKNKVECSSLLLFLCARIFGKEGLQVE